MTHWTTLDWNKYADNTIAIGSVDHTVKVWDFRRRIYDMSVRVWDAAAPGENKM
ncbi:hypothetical protein BC936DRAFT_139989, partial [Jimgerdemannia flammicorona]